MTTVPQPADPTKSYTATYDAWNRLVKLVDGANSVSEYEYDGAKRRTIQKSYSAGVLDETRHLYYTEPSRWQVIEERIDASTNPDRQFVWGLRYVDDLVERDRDTTGNGTLDERLYAMQDANWNVDAVCDTTATVHERYSYTAYGAPAFLTRIFSNRPSSNHAWETFYAGYRRETATSLFHVRHRVYSATLGAWAQRDPLGLAAGPTLYSYVMSRPIQLRDAHGLISILPAPVGVPFIQGRQFLDWMVDCGKCACSWLEALDIIPLEELVGILLDAFLDTRKELILHALAIETVTMFFESLIGAMDCLCAALETYTCKGVWRHIHGGAAMAECLVELKWVGRLENPIWEVGSEIIFTVVQWWAQQGGFLDPFGMLKAKFGQCQHCEKDFLKHMVPIILW